MNIFLVRSLGSVAMKKAQDSKTDFHFNFFVLNLNEVCSIFSHLNICNKNHLFIIL